MTFKERHAPNTTPPLPPWTCPERPSSNVPSTCGCPLPKMGDTGFCYDHGQNAMLALDTELVRLYNRQQELQRQSDLLKQAIYIHRGGLTRIASVEPKTKTHSADALKLQALIDGFLKD